jgi:hypothetical protein
VDQALFEAVQTKLTASATARQLRLRSSPAILAGRIFDDRGNRMTPTHTNKHGARYRYYVCPTHCYKSAPTRPAACRASRRQRSKASCSTRYVRIANQSVSLSFRIKNKTRVACLLLRVMHLKGGVLDWRERTDA